MLQAADDATAAHSEVVDRSPRHRDPAVAGPTALVRRMPKALTLTPVASLASAASR